MAATLSMWIVLGNVQEFLGQDFHGIASLSRVLDSFTVVYVQLESDMKFSVSVHALLAAVPEVRVVLDVHSPVAVRGAVKTIAVTIGDLDPP